MLCCNKKAGGHRETSDHLMVTTTALVRIVRFAHVQEGAKPLPHPPAEISSRAQSPHREKGGYLELSEMRTLNTSQHRSNHSCPAVSQHSLC